MSRCAILPFPGDPFLLHYWLKFFDEVWQDEVDKLYIMMNSPVEQEVVEYVRELCGRNPKIKLVYGSTQIEHGDVIKSGLHHATEDLVMLIEDDGFIFKKGIVDECFKYLESGEYDIVGSRRGSCAIEILTRGNQLWNTETVGEGDSGCNFWPNFFFCSRAKLLATDQDFKAKAWKHGDIIKELGDYMIQDDVSYGDTFVWASLQLQATTPQNRIKYINQYHASPDDMDHFQRSYNIFDGICRWTHIGSLSSGVGGLLQDSHGRQLVRRLIDESKGDNIPVPNYCNTEAEKREFERRVQWWQTGWENREQGKLEEFAQLYFDALQRLIDQYGLSRNNIERRQRIYQSIGL